MSFNKKYAISDTEKVKQRHIEIQNLEYQLISSQSTTNFKNETIFN